MRTLDDFQLHVKEMFQSIDMPDKPERLYEPIRYTLSQGGKRLRPFLAFVGCYVCDGNIEEVVPAAKGLEIFHNFTLLHDDIMDQAPIRRGMPTVYKKWDVNTAILSGDTMFVIAYEHITRSHKDILKDILDLFNTTAREVCEGQQLDMDYEMQPEVSIGDYLEMIRLKTAVLIAGSLKTGAIAARAPKSTQDNLYEFGLNLGLAFQLMDDLLDTYGNEKVFGKKTGNDIVTNKKTFLYLKAYEKADFNMRKELDYAYRLSDKTAKVARVKELFDQLNIKAETEFLIEDFNTNAKVALDKISKNNERTRLLYDINDRLLKRDY